MADETQNGQGTQAQPGTQTQTSDGSKAVAGTQGTQDPKTSTQAAGARTLTKAQRDAQDAEARAEQEDAGEPVATKEKSLSQVNQAFGFITHKAADPSTPNSGVYFQELQYDGEGEEMRITGMDDAATNDAYSAWKKQNGVDADTKPVGEVPDPQEA